MIAPRTLRMWLRRFNVVLLAIVVGLAIHTATWSPSPREPLPEQPCFDGTQPWAPTGDSEVDFDRFLTYLRTFHPAPPPVLAPDPTPTKPSRLPLRAYRIAMLIHKPGDEPCLVLKPKDPSLGRTYHLAHGRPHRGTRLVWLRREGRLVLVRIERGEEAFTFKFRTDAPVRRGGLRVAALPRSRVRADGSSGVGGSRGRAAPLVRDLKGLPFFGADGAVIGLRVSGVRPGSYFARVGLKAGDVITGAEDGSTATIEDFRARLGDGWHPRTLTILRDVATSRSTLTLRDS